MCLNGHESVTNLLSAAACELPGATSQVCKGKDHVKASQRSYCHTTSLLSRRTPQKSGEGGGGLPLRGGGGECLYLREQCSRRVARDSVASHRSVAPSRVRHRRSACYAASQRGTPGGCGATKGGWESKLCRDEAHEPVKLSLGSVCSHDGRCLHGGHKHVF